MNTDAQNFLKKFSTKKDALTALDELILVTDESCFLVDAPLEYFNKYTAIKEEIEKYQNEDLANQVMAYFNKVYSKNYQNTEKISSIIRQIPKVTFEQFQSVILHKLETWGNDDKMRQYLRPATLFGSKQKFITYLEDATDYWIQKQKHDR
jgi:uncharacterized phage protein (TIGR02220 family)